MPNLPECAILAGCFGVGVAGGITADRITTPQPSPTVLKYPEKMPWQRPDPNDPVAKVWESLQKPTFMGVDDQSRSYEEIMAATGYQVFEPLSTGPWPQTGTAHQEGLNVRAYPTTNRVLSPIVERIRGGEVVSWRGEFPSLNPDGSMHVFGLRVGTNPTYIAIRTHHPDGTINWYVKMASTLVQGPDGSYDFGKHGFGPTTADIQAVNRK